MRKYSVRQNRVSCALQGVFGSSLIRSKAQSFLSKDTDQKLEKHQKTGMLLKFLQKYQQKTLIGNQALFQNLVEHHENANRILLSISQKTLQQAKSLHKKKQQLQLKQQLKIKRQRQKLISSWTAFQNLDITYKTKQENLKNQNLTLSHKIVELQNKIKKLYSTQKQEITIQTQQVQIINKRIEQHQYVIQKLTEKICKKENKKLRFQDTYIAFVDKCKYKYGDHIVPYIDQYFFQDQVI